VTPPLSSLTTLQLGGPPKAYVEAADEQQLVAAVRAAEPPVLVLAGGSNLVVADEGFPGTAVHVRTRGIERDGASITVAAGEPWDDVVAYAVAEGLGGIECLSGIPGSTGATPIQNVGAYGQEVAETIASVRVYDRETDAVSDLAPADCGFGYRTSRFKYRDRWVVLSVSFALERSALSGPLRYAELAAAVGAERAPLAEVREAVLALRRGKGMVVDPADPDSVSAGSFFTNPILDADAFAPLGEQGAPGWPEPDGRVKTSAAWLIGRAGIERGHAVGRAAISSKHTLALTNRGGATTQELVALAREVRDAVRDRFAIELHPEPVLVGVAL
jgi:UDP-N-acetylmuramate dehydrogenase